MSPSVERGGKASEKSGAAPPVVIEMPDEESHVGVEDKVKKGSRMINYAKNFDYFRLARYNFFLIALVAIVVLAIQVSRDQDKIQELNHEMDNVSRVHDQDRIGGRMSYLQGFSGMIDDDDDDTTDTAVIAARDVTVSGDPSMATNTVVSTSISTVAPTMAPSVGETSATETCNNTTDADTTVNVLRTTTAFFSSVGSTTETGQSTTTSGTTQTTLSTQMTTTVFSNTTGISVLSVAAASSLPAGTSLFSVDPLSASPESSMATATASATASTTSGLVPNNPHNCLEFGDGAGPCNRPYGAPNTPPSSIVLSVNTATDTYPLPSLSTISSTSPTLPGGVTLSSTTLGMTTMDTGAMSGTATTSSSTISVVSTSTVSSMETTTSSSVSDVETSVCGPPTTIYVTLSSSTDTLSVEGGVTIASFGTASGSGPSTVTSTSTSLATTITMSVASVTETVSNSSITTSSHLFTATGFTLTMTAHGNGTYKPTTTGPTTIATLPANSGSDKAAGGKPMGASGNGGTGNGMYCVVMLVTLLALLI